MGSQVKETLTFLDDDIARFMEEAARADAWRGSHRRRSTEAGYYETAFRVLGRYMDEQKPRDVFFFEQDGAFVVRLLIGGQAGSRHELAEFTRDDIAQMVARGPRPSPAGRRARRPGQHHQRLTHGPAIRPSHPSHITGGLAMKALKTVAVALGITLAALIVIPLAVLAGLFVWLKLTEEADEELLELDREGA